MRSLSPIFLPSLRSHFCPRPSRSMGRPKKTSKVSVSLSKKMVVQIIVGCIRCTNFCLLFLLGHDFCLFHPEIWSPSSSSLLCYFDRPKVKRHNLHFSSSVERRRRRVIWPAQRQKDAICTFLLAWSHDSFAFSLFFLPSCYEIDECFVLFRTCSNRRQ
jgi:hypothetical protein